MVQPDHPAYDLVAEEYYDPIRHPTCRNFGELSERFLRPRIERFAAADGWCLEIGAGRSVAAPVFSERGAGLNRLVLLDRSRAMLDHSCHWRVLGAKLLVADAAESAMGDATISLVVAGLGDPYNSSMLWDEVCRILVPGGSCLFTTPAAEWAMRFRDAATQSEAEFMLGDGTAVAVPSNVLSVADQMQLVASAKLRVVEVTEFTAAQLVSPLSGKLDVFDGASHVPIVRGFIVRKD